MNQIALIIGSIMIALGLIAAAVVPLVAQEPAIETPEPITPANMTGVAEGTTENQSEMSPATKR